MCIGPATQFCAGFPVGRMDWREPSRSFGFSDKGHARASPGSGRTASELNHILWVHTYWYKQECTSMHFSKMTFGLFSAGACCGWYLDNNLWLCWVGVWAFPGCNACQMLPLASKQELSWCEPTGKHVHTVTYKYIQVHTCTYLKCYSWSVLMADCPIRTHHTK